MVPPEPVTPGPLALTRSTVERSTTRRSDDGWLAEAWASPSSRVLVVQDGEALARFGDSGAELLFVSPGQAPEGTRFLLGVDSADVAYFGVAAVLPDAPEETVRPAGLRSVGSVLSDRDAGLLTHAVALANWHASAGFCPRCGAATDPAPAGHIRRCSAEGTDIFPRIDPAVIMLITDPGDRCLLARNTRWPVGRVSVLAGFVEPGESAEEAVAREVREETGVVVGAVHYAASQPWPMPFSLMLGFRGEAVETRIEVDDDEISEAAWYSRDDLREALVSGRLLMPPSLSISRWLIETWYGGPLPASAGQPGRPASA